MLLSYTIIVYFIITKECSTYAAGDNDAKGLSKTSRISFILFLFTYCLLARSLSGEFKSFVIRQVIIRNKVPLSK